MKHHRKIVLIMFVGLLSACSSVDPVGTYGNQVIPKQLAADEINWPQQYQPEDATFTLHNEIDIDAPPEVVWEILIQAETWPDWYEGAFDVDIKNSATGRLEGDSVFTWNTMGQDFESNVTEFVPPYRLGWESHKATIQAYHAWLLVPTDDGGTRLITDEAQYGLLANLQKIFMPNKLYNLHEIWLQEIKEKAENNQSSPIQSKPRKNML